MSKVTMYSSLYIIDEKESIRFFTKFLNFSLIKNLSISIDEDWWVLVTNEQEKRGLILIKASHQNHNKSTLILNTQDGILAYCKLKDMGIKDSSEPIYSALGLSFNFYDPSGNQIIILEERIYNDLEI